MTDEMAESFGVERGVSFVRTSARTCEESCEHALQVGVEMAISNM